MEKVDAVRSTTDDYLAPVVTVGEKLRAEVRKIGRTYLLLLVSAMTVAPMIAICERYYMFSLTLQCMCTFNTPFREVPSDIKSSFDPGCICFGLVATPRSCFLSPSFSLAQFVAT
jgi:hypothetical protein